MSFTVPNITGLTYPFEARVYSTDWHILGASAGGRHGVVTGCLVAQSASPGMSVLVTAGICKFDGESVDVAGGTVTISNADPSFPRWDLIIALDDGSLDVSTGTAAATPVPDDPDALHTTAVALAYVFVPALDTAIVNEQIVDKRVTVLPELGASQWTTLTALTNATRTATTLLAIDPILQFTMLANTKYRIRGDHWFSYNLTNSGPFKWGLATPTAPTFSTIVASYQPTGSGIAGLPVTVPSGNALTSYVVPTPFTTGLAVFTSNAPALVYLNRVVLDGIVHNGANEAAFGLTWAQNNASASILTRYAGSYLEYEVVA